MHSGLGPILKSLVQSPIGPLLVAIQVAITFTFMVNATFAISHMTSVMHRPTGMAVEDIFWFRSYAYTKDFDYSATVRSDLDRLARMPDVLAATITNTVPLSNTGNPIELSTSPDQNAPAQTAAVYFSTEHTLNVLGSHLVSGRSFDATTVAPPRANDYETLANLPGEAIVTQALANRLFPDGKALGASIYGPGGRQLHIVGILDRMMGPWPDAPYNQQTILVPAISPGPHATYMVRTRPGKRDGVMAQIAAAIPGKDSGRVIGDLRALSDTAAVALAGQRVTSQILIVVLVLMLVISALGVFASAMFGVVSRTKEIGVRRALGATQSDIAADLIAEALLVTTAGLVPGVVLAALAASQIDPLLGVANTPPAYFVLSAIALWLITLAATVIPMRAASRTTPAVATRAV